MIKGKIINPLKKFLYNNKSSNPKLIRAFFSCKKVMGCYFQAGNGAGKAENAAPSCTGEDWGGCAHCWASDEDWHDSWVACGRWVGGLGMQKTWKRSSWVMVGVARSVVAAVLPHPAASPWPRHLSCARSFIHASRGVPVQLAATLQPSRSLYEKQTVLKLHFQLALTRSH